MPFKERNKLKRYICIVFTHFHHTKLYPFQNLSLEFILKVFLRFRKFHPRYSYKIYSYRKKGVYLKVLEVVFLRTYASSRVKRKSSYRKSELQIFCWFSAAKFVYQIVYKDGVSIQSCIKGAWDVSANKSDRARGADFQVGELMRTR